MGKKGVFFDIMIVIVFLIIMLTALYVFSDKHKKISNERMVGELEYKFIETMQAPEKSLLYLDYAAKYSLIKTIYNLSANGGARTPKCGEFEGYALWSTKEKGIGECFPNYINETRNMLDGELDAYITYYNMNNQKNTQRIMPPYFPMNNYEYRIVPSVMGIRVQGFAKENLIIENEEMKYSVKPNFEAMEEYNINEYEYLKDDAIAIINLCYKNSTDELKKCVEDVIVEPLKIAESEGRMFAFEYSTKKILFEEQPIAYRFAIYIVNESSSVPFVRVLETPKEQATQEVVTSLQAAYSLQYNIDKNLTDAIIMQESNGNQNAIRCEQSYEDRWKELSKNCIQYGCAGLIDSPQGRFHKVSCSYGVMQIMYPTALETCSDIVTTPETLFDAATNVECGTRYLKKMIEECGSVKRAIYAYNQGPKDCKTADAENDEYVAAVLRNCESIGGCVLV